MPIFDYELDFDFGSFGQGRVSPLVTQDEAEVVAITGMEGGGYVVAYQLQQTTFLRVYDVNGEPVGDPVSLSANLSFDVSLVGMPDGVTATAPVPPIPGVPVRGG